MTYSSRFCISQGGTVRLKALDPGSSGKHEKKKAARREIEKLQKRMNKLQFRLFAEGKQSLLIILQALDAGGKDGVVRHVIGSMNPQGCRVVNFKQPSKTELAHNFLWRIQQQTPKPGGIVVFNRSQYEDVLIVRVHDLVPQKVWSMRYNEINDFEQQLIDGGTHILKFFLHISKDEQLERFGKRLDDPEKQWKISEADYSERTYWDNYEKAYEDVLDKCSTADAPWFVIPSDHKWFRNLAISRIIVETMESLDIQLPKTTVNIADIKKKYHHAVYKGKQTTKEK